MRQHEEALIKAVRECGHGDLTEETIQFLGKLNREVEGEAVKIFPTNQQVDVCNQAAILKLDGMNCIPLKLNLFLYTGCFNLSAITNDIDAYEIIQDARYYYHLTGARSLLYFLFKF